MQARQLLIATGAMERPVPLPGWTLPGVLGAGAADVLLKSASMLPEGPVVLCGNGPLILQTVVHLKHFGIPIAGVALTGSPASLFKAALRMPGALLRPQYLLHGMGMGLRTFFGAPCHPAANDISIRRDGETLTVLAVNRSGETLELSGDLRAFGNVSFKESSAMTCDDLKAINTESAPDRVKPGKGAPAAVDGGRFTAVLDAYSWNVLQFNVR